MLGDLADKAQVVGHLGPLADAEQLVADIAEPLSASAPVAYEIARHNCIANLEDPPADCRAYHALWQYLRLTEVIRSLRADGPLFVAVAKRRAEAGRLNRILICGTADYSMLAHLGHGARLGGTTPHIDVIDRCRSTLGINAWYARERGLNVRTIATDVTAFAPDQPYDLICTHSFLSWLPPPERPALLKRWHAWLTPGGEVCFSNRIDPETGYQPDGGHARRSKAMTDEFFAKCDERRIALPADRATFEQLFREYTARAPFRKRDMPMSALRRWLSDAALEPALIARVEDVVSGGPDRASAPIETEGRARMWFLARRA